MAPLPTFEQTYADCHRHVHSLYIHVLSNNADAQDAFQETFMAVAQALPSFRSEANIHCRIENSTCAAVANGNAGPIAGVLRWRGDRFKHSIRRRAT